ncbi:MAG TPA: flagellar hook-length control protein FliK [Clostridiaceae bacterium]|nr:flagellar hook-length control protein FliK [Clostridiaceae bacterium]
MNTANVNQAASRQILQILARNTADSQVALETLNAGDIIRGRIQSVDNGLLLIKLLDGAVFTAQAPEGFAAGAGDPVTLMIGEKMNDQLTARIISEPQAGSRPVEENTLVNRIHNALSSLGVAAYGKVAEKVMELLKEEPGMPLDKAAFLVANGLSGNRDLREIIGKIADHEFNLHENLKELENNLLDLTKAMDPGKSAAMIKPVIIKQTIEDLSAELKLIYPEVPEKLIESVSEKLNEILMKTLMEEMNGKGSADASDIVTKEVFEAIIGNAMRLSSADKGSGAVSDKSYPVFDPGQAEKILKVINRTLEDYHTKAEKLSREGEDGVKEMKEAIGKLFDKAYIKADDGIVRDMDTREKTQALKDIMELAQKVIRHAGDNARESITPVFREIDNAFKFFSQVVTYNSIIQLPLKINGSDSTGELYIMRRKRGRNGIDKENFTLFMSLETKSLGLVESYLNAARKRITISFRVESEDLLKVFKDNQKALYDRLLEKGYILVEMKCRLLDGERLNPFNAGAREKELFGSETRVDIRI